MLYSLGFNSTEKGNTLEESDLFVKNKNQPTNQKPPIRKQPKPPQPHTITINHIVVMKH